VIGRGVLAAACFVLVGLAAPATSLAEPPRAGAPARRAPPDRAAARAAYDRGVAAHARGDLRRAARELATADALAPDPVTLGAALDATVDADDVALGAELLDRSQGRPSTPALRTSIEAARRHFAGRAPAATAATPEPSGTSANAGPNGTGPNGTGPNGTGPNDPSATVPGAVGADEGAAAGASEAAPNDRPLPPFVFWVGVGATVLAGGATAVLMSSAASRHDDFVAGGCERAPEAGCDGLRDRGEGAQTRANVMLGVTAVLAVATVVIGVAFTRFRPDHPPRAAGPPGLRPSIGGPFGTTVVRF